MLLKTIVTVLITSSFQELFVLQSVMKLITVTLVLWLVALNCIFYLILIDYSCYIFFSFQIIIIVTQILKCCILAFFLHFQRDDDLCVGFILFTLRANLLNKFNVEKWSCVHFISLSI